MPWVRFDDQFPIHRKVEGLTDGAFRLAVSAIFWSSRQLTDGCIPKRDLVFAAPRTMKRPEKFVKELVEIGLWETTSEGWNLHDFLDYQPSKEQVTADRAKTAERQKRWRERHNKPVTDDVSNGGSNGVTNPVSNAAPSRPVPSRPEVLNKNSCSSASPPNDSDEPPSLIPSPPRAPKPGSDSDPDWLKFWAIYPRKSSKEGARGKWATAVKKAKAADIIAGAEQYRDDPNRDQEFTKDPKTWLGNGCWADDPLPARNGTQSHQAYRDHPADAYRKMT